MIVFDCRGRSLCRPVIAACLKPRSRRFFVITGVVAYLVNGSGKVFDDVAGNQAYVSRFFCCDIGGEAVKIDGCACSV